jgi:molybdenum cofactor synthesis domain-containing protein
MTVQVAVITISDRSSRGERPDSSGPVLVEEVLKAGWKVSTTQIIPDDFEIIRNTLVDLCDHAMADLILTTGGTGFSSRDVTPEATLSVVDRQAPGIAEAMRYESLKITPHAMLSRAVAGIRKKTLIINFPGSPKAARENFNVVKPVLPHAVELLQESPHSEQGHQL